MVQRTIAPLLGELFRRYPLRHRHRTAAVGQEDAVPAPPPHLAYVNLESPHHGSSPRRIRSGSSRRGRAGSSRTRSTACRRCSAGCRCSRTTTAGRPLRADEQRTVPAVGSDRPIPGRTHRLLRLPFSLDELPSARGGDRRRRPLSRVHPPVHDQGTDPGQALGDQVETVRRARCQPDAGRSGPRRVPPVRAPVRRAGSACSQPRPARRRRHRDPHPRAALALAARNQLHRSACRRTSTTSGARAGPSTPRASRRFGRIPCAPPSSRTPSSRRPSSTATAAGAGPTSASSATAAAWSATCSTLPRDRSLTIEAKSGATIASDYAAQLRRGRRHPRPRRAPDAQRW